MDQKELAQKLLNTLKSLGAPAVFDDGNWDLGPRRESHWIKLSEEHVETMNFVFEAMAQLSFKRTKLTHSGGVSTDKQYFKEQVFSYHIDDTTLANSFRIIIIFGPLLWHFQFGGVEGVDGQRIDALSAYQTFARVARTKFNLNLKDNRIDVEEGYRIKQEEIEPPFVHAYQTHKVTDPFVQHVHCLDIHSAYPAALAQTHPEFAPLIKYLYERRKDNPDLKAALNVSIGWFQRKKCPDHANLARDAINRHNQTMRELCRWIEEQGGTVLLTRTDSIWYTNNSPVPFHDTAFISREGSHLGQWSYQEIDAQLRIKSRGAYEYIDHNGKLHIKLCGLSHLDRIKPRDEWTPDDLYSNDAAPFAVQMVDDGQQVRFLIKEAQ